MVSRALVVGSGAIGLRTALELIRRNVAVILQSPVHPLDSKTCSVGAGGLWMPFRCDDPRVDRWAIETLDELLLLAKDPKHKDLVEILPCVQLMRTHSGPSVEDFAKGKYESKLGEATKSKVLPEWTTDPRVKFQHLTVEMLSWQNNVNRLRIPPEQELKEAGYLHAWLFFPPIVNAPRMLEHLLAEISMHADQVNVETGHYFSSLQQMREAAANLGCDTVVNCTGLGAGAICNDDQIKGGRGVLFQFDRAKCVRRPEIQQGLAGENTKDALIMTDDTPFGSDTMPCYLIPRGDKIVVGGSYLLGDTETGIREDERKRLLLNAERLGIDVNASEIVGEWTGFRPSRPTVRCEIDKCFMDGVKVLHNYGHGGSGWTVNVGAARHCVNLLLGTK